MRSIALEIDARRGFGMYVHNTACTHTSTSYVSVSHDTRHAWSLKSLWMLNAFGYVALGRMNYPFHTSYGKHVHVIVQRE